MAAVVDRDADKAVRERIWQHPAEFCRDVLDFHAWSKQAEIMEAVRDHERVAVRSCHGVGKTATAAHVALWFLVAHRDSRVITTAPTWAQVEQQLWREIRDAVKRSRIPFPDPLTTKLELDEKWFAIGLSTDQPERFQGHHARRLLLIVDEASGVSEGIFEASEGFLTGQGARLLLIGNPTRIGGQFHKAFTTERAAWRTIHVSVEDSPNYTDEPVPEDVGLALPRKAWAEEKARQWGVDSPMYQVRVLGNFPSQASNAVLSLDQVEAAQARTVAADATLQPVVIACDVARYGDDETVIGRRVGDQVRLSHQYVSVPPGAHPTVHTAGLLVAMIKREGPGNVRVVIDDTGVGGGVTDLVRSTLADDPQYAIVPVTAFNGAERAFNPDGYPNRRSEHWFAMRDRLPELDLDQDEQLAADLSSPTYRMDASGRRVVEPKEQMKARLGRSPDRADMVLLTLVPPVGDALPVSAPAAPDQSDPLAPSSTNYLDAAW